MKRIFEIPANYNGHALFDTIEELTAYTEDHEEELADLRIFKIYFDTDEWSQCKGVRQTLEDAIHDFEVKTEPYFDDVKSQHGCASICYERNGEYVTVFCEEF